MRAPIPTHQLPFLKERCMFIFKRVMIVFFTLSLFACAIHANEITLTPSDDIAIANDGAMSYNAGGLNDGSHQWLTVANYKC